MSQNFREFVFAEVGTLSWIGEQCMFTDNFLSCYSARAKTEVTVLEFAISDLRDILRNVYRDYMQEVALKKQILLLERTKEIISSSKSQFDQQELSNFYKSVSDTISKLYPNASRKIVKQIAR
jgi:CRP-like cAMP-binding protein